MKDELRLAVALRKTFENAESANEKWAVLNRSDVIWQRSKDRLDRAETREQMDIIAEHAPVYIMMRTTAARLKISLSTPKVLSLF